MTPQLQATLAKLPTKPGVYLLKDDRGRVLYVGKAQSLRNRVRQYWQAGRGSAAPLRIESAIDRVTDVEYTMVDSVSEALLLEATLIKRHQPRFNVRLKDDKSYPYIKVTLGDDLVTTVNLTVTPRGYGNLVTLDDGPFDISRPGVVDAYALGRGARQPARGDGLLGRSAPLPLRLGGRRQAS